MGLRGISGGGLEKTERLLKAGAAAGGFRPPPPATRSAETAEAAGQNPARDRRLRRRVLDVGNEKQRHEGHLGV